jgi:zinc transporter ZupT
MMADAVSLLPIDWFMAWAFLCCAGFLVYIVFEMYAPDLEYTENIGVLWFYVTFIGAAVIFMITLDVIYRMYVLSAVGGI